MQGNICESILKNRSFRRDCGCLFDERTRARLERENQETWRGLLNLKKHERICKKEIAKSQQEDESKKGIDEDKIPLSEKSKQVAKRTGERAYYRFTKWSKLKMLRVRKEEEKWETYLHHYKKCKFFESLINLKITLSHKEWDHSCHLKERTIIRRNIRLENILRIRWKYKISETLPSDSTVFDKIMKREQERKKQLKLRQERMIKIIEKIAREMNNGIRLLKKPKTIRSKGIELDEISLESLAEISFEEDRSEKSGTEVTSLKNVPVIKENASKRIKDENKVRDSQLKPEGDKKNIETEIEEVISKDKNDFEKSVTLKESKSSIEQVFPEDTCFFAIPNIVTFDDFELKKVYSRKIIIRNKTAKWAYLRFHKIYTEVWEPGVVEIDTMDAARVKPGLDVPVNVKFSPVYEEEVRAEISFLTLSPEDTKTFHEFRVPVRCTPQSAVPIVDPRELRFPSAPIWKYDDSKFSERVLTISNDGKKSFSIAIEERNDHDHCFLWNFNQAEIESVKSSILYINEDKYEEKNIETAGENILKDPKSRKVYRIEVPSKFKCNLTISFRPRYTGLHHEVLEISFLIDNRIFGKQSVPIWTEVTGYQIHLDPPCVDLGIVMIDSDVCQQTFNIINTGRSSVEVLIKTPKYLGNQVSVYPKSTIVQQDIFSKISVRLIPESNILKIGKRYLQLVSEVSLRLSFYDPISNMLEFPIQVQILSQDPEKPPPLIVKVLASLTTCHGLILEPAYIDLGYVYTHESVYTKLSLTNASLLIQDYAFLNLPTSIEIQPNHGFGTILPGETINLHLIYSACLTDIPGNEIGANGLAGERSFGIQVVTLAELAGSKKRTMLNKLKNQINTKSKISRNRGFPPPLSINLKTPKLIRQKNDRDKDNFENRTDSDLALNETDLGPEETVIVSTEESRRIDGRREKNTIEIYVYIIDNYCELSEQIFKFAATPCGSFSMASVQLRGFNVASYPHCTCGILKNQNKEFTARYEFKSSSDRVTIMPQSGILHSNEIIQVDFLFEPRLPKSMIFEEGLRLKMNFEDQETRNLKEEKSPRKEKRSTRKVAKKETPDKKPEISNVDELAGETSLLETFEPCISTIFITCTLDIEMKNGTKHDELLFAKLICPITRPEILLLNEKREIAFGPTAIGTSSRKFLLVKNISNQSVKVEASLLDPFGPFFAPPGRTIETGSVLRLPVTYQPMQQREQNEYFEVSSPKSRTRWRLKVSGRGVVPSYVLKPRFRVARFEVTDEKPAELRMSVQNTGSCPLILRLYLIDVLEGEIARDPEESPSKSAGRKRKGKGDGTSSGKSSRRVEFGDNLRPNEELAILGGNLQRSTDRNRFSFWNLDEKMQLVVPERKKMEFGVRFHPKREENVFDSKETAETAPKGKKKSKKGKKTDELKKSNYYHVAMVKLMLGSSTLNDFAMICLAK